MCVCEREKKKKEILHRLGKECVSLVHPVQGRLPFVVPPLLGGDLQSPVALQVSDYPGSLPGNGRHSDRVSAGGRRWEEVSVVRWRAAEVQ